MKEAAKKQRTDFLSIPTHAKWFLSLSEFDQFGPIPFGKICIIKLFYPGGLNLNIRQLSLLCAHAMAPTSGNFQVILHLGLNLLRLRVLLRSLHEWMGPRHWHGIQYPTCRCQCRCFWSIFDVPQGFRVEGQGFSAATLTGPMEN